MSVTIHVEGALEPVTISDPFQATLVNLSASVRTNSTFFVGNGLDGNLVAFHIPKITHIVQGDEA